MIKFEVCKKCNLKKPIANSRGICVDCVYERNHQGKSRDQVSKERRVKKNIVLKSDMFAQDEQFYELCFNLKLQICEECGKKLPNIFRDENGKIIARHRYSHILPKSTYPRLRHNIDNINILCFDCHYKWEFGDRKKMNIYESNLRIIDKLRSK